MGGGISIKKSTHADKRGKELWQNRRASERVRERQSFCSSIPVKSAMGMAAASKGQ